MSSLPARLKELRAAKSIKQSDISDLLDVKSRIVTYYESGERVPPLDKLIILADFFQVSLDYLVGRSDDMTYTPRQKPEPRYKQEDYPHIIPEVLAFFNQTDVDVDDINNPEFVKYVERTYRLHKK